MTIIIIDNDLQDNILVYYYTNNNNKRCIIMITLFMYSDRIISWFKLYNIARVPDL